jgi:hypothetical protein
MSPNSPAQAHITLHYARPPGTVRPLGGDTRRESYKLGDSAKRIRRMRQWGWRTGECFALIGLRAFTGWLSAESAS